MSTVSAKTAIPEDPNGVESLTAAEGQNERESALPVDNNTSNAVELGTLDCPEAGTGANTVNEAKDDGDVATRASLVEGLLMNGSVIGNAEVAAAEQKPLLSPKTLENADTLFQEVCDALKAGGFVDAVDFLNLCSGNQDVERGHVSSVFKEQNDGNIDNDGGPDMHGDAELDSKLETAQLVLGLCHDISKVDMDVERGHVNNVVKEQNDGNIDDDGELDKNGDAEIDSKLKASQ